MCGFTIPNDETAFEVVDTLDNETVDIGSSREDVQAEVDSLNALFGQEVFKVRVRVAA